MNKNYYLLLILALLIGLNALILMPTTKALFTSSIMVANNNIGTGSWPSLTPTPIPTATPTPTLVPTLTPTPLPTATPTPNPDVANTRISPASTTVAAGQNFTVNLVVSNAQDLGAFQTTISYNPNNVEFVSAALGPFISSTGRSASILGPIIDATGGTVTYGAYTLGSTPLGPNGEGALASFTFKAKIAGQSNLNITDMEVDRRAGTIQPNGSISGGTIIVQ